jgi:hemerythrin-like domain-containing protein
MDERGRERRGLLAGAAGTGLVLIAGGAGAAKPADGKKQPAREKGGDIPPTEDLMREHGVLRRVLLVYDEAARRLAGEDASPMAAVAFAANIVHRFVEGYHEKLEEQFVFPRLEKAGTLTDLTKVLRAQHAAGRKLTDAIMKSAKAGKAATAQQRRAVVADLQSFGRMYAPHAAWEDTELFPAYRGLFTERELDELGEQFEDQEHKLLGGAGFEGSLREVGELEKALGIHDLAKFTPA